jgi:YD repeat-containing protein
MSFTKCREAERVLDTCAGVLPITKWTFTNGLSVTFDYQLAAPFVYSDAGLNSHTCCLGVGQLVKVSNNLGRSLSFGYTASPDPTGAAGKFYRSRITSVTSDAGQQATYQTSGCSSSPYDLFFCSTLSVTTPEGTTKYDYVAGADSPDPAVVAATPNYRLRRIFFPLTPSVASLVFAYDDKGRVASITDALGHQGRYFPAGMASTEAWKRAESLNPLGASTISIFDDRNSLVRVTDPLDRTATTTYDNAGRKLTETHPEGDSATYSYDVRSNLLTTTRYPKPGSTLPSIMTSATYGEGATVFLCANWKTCNKPLTETDARGYVSNYSWEAATGFPSQILMPADAAGIRPQTDFSYTNYTATDGATLRLLTGKTDKVSASQNIVTTYAYDAANKFVLKSATTDPGGVAATACFQFDAIGNLVGTTDPRASACP